MIDFYTLKLVKKHRSLKVFFCIIFLLPSLAAAQNLPGEIRGYKVYKTDVSVKNQADKNADIDKNKTKSGSEAFIIIGEPIIADLSLTALVIELSAEIKAIDQSGTIDFLTFKDFRANDLTITVEEYNKSFTLKKNQPVTLPKPVRISVGTGQALRGALKEFKDSKDEWKITGTVFVFGHFKKSLFKFKRVIPVKINLTIKNPLKETS